MSNLRDLFKEFKERETFDDLEKNMKLMKL